MIPPRPSTRFLRGLSALLLVTLAASSNPACTRLDAAVPSTLELQLIRPSDPSDVFLNEELVFFFSRDVDRASVTRASVRIRSRDGHDALGSLQVEGQRIRFVPAPVLSPALDDGGYRPGTDYDVEIAGFPRADGIRGVAGEPLARTVRWSFRTVSAGVPRSRLIFDDRHQDKFRPVFVFPQPPGAADAPYPIAPQGSVYLACEKPIDPASVRAADFRFHRAPRGEEIVGVRARLIENEPNPAVRPRPAGVISAFPDAWTRQPRAALIEITPRQPLALGSWRLVYRPGTAWVDLARVPDPVVASALTGLVAYLDSGTVLRDFSAARVLESGWGRTIRVDPAIVEPGRGALVEDFDSARLRSPIAAGGADGTAYWSDVGRVEVRYPAAAGDGADGDVRLGAREPRKDVRALALDLPAGARCELDAEPGLVVLRSQGRMTIAGKLVRATRASAPDPTLVAWQSRPPDARAEETLSAWLARTRANDLDWTVLVAGGDLVIEGALETTTPLLLCAGGVIRVSGSVRGVANQVFLLREGGGLNIDPPATFAPLWIDPPAGTNPLVRRLRFAVLSSPIPSNGDVGRWLSTETRGSDGRSRYPERRWRVRYLPEIRSDRADLDAIGAVESPLELGRGGPLQLLIELVVEPGGLWDPPWVDSVRLSWEQR